jgi:hypothetical protein
MVDGVQVLITSGSLDTTKTPSYLNPLSIPPTMDSRTKVLHADGIEAYSLSLGFDVTQNFLDILTTVKLFKRRYQFDVGFNDGENNHGLLKCYLTSLSVSGAAGGLMSASLSVISTSTSTPIIPDDYIGFQGSSSTWEKDRPMGYWYSGNQNVKDWSLAMSQEVVPVYLNKDVTTPQYMRVGMIGFTLQVSTYEALYPTGYSPTPTAGTDKVKISTSAFTITGKVTAENKSFNGPSELGGYSHTFETSSDTGDSSGIIITSP